MDLYKHGFLVQPNIRFRNTGYKINIDQEYLRSLEFNVKLGMLKKNIDKSKRRKEFILNDIKNALKFERSQSNSNQSVILMNTLELGQMLKDELSSSYNVLYIDANTKAKERNKIFSDLTDNKITDYVLIGTSKLLGEGTDIPSIKNVFCASPAYPPFEDTARLQQIIGRAMRPFPNKNSANIVIYNDETTGWINKKKNEVLDIVFNNVKPVIN